MNMKILKCLRNVNRFIDDDYQKLCDRYHSLELSHNRKKRALKQIRDFLYNLPVAGGLFIPIYELADFDLQRLLHLCDDALFCDGRQNCPSFVQRKKKKGGRQCAQD